MKLNVAQTLPPNKGWLKPLLAPAKPLFRELLVLSLFVNLLAAAVPVFVLQVYDRVVFHAGLTTLQGLVIGMIFVLAFDYMLRETRAKVMQSIGVRLDVQVSQALFDKLVNVPLRTLEKFSAAYWQLLFRDVDTVRNTLSGPTAVLLADLPFVLLFLIVVILIAAPVAWVLLVAMILFGLAAWQAGKTVSTAAEEEKSAAISRDALMTETLTGRTTIKALAMADQLRPQWEDKLAESVQTSAVRGRLNDRFANLGQTLTLLTTVMMTTVGAVAIIDQNMTIGGLIAANMLSSRIMGPLNQLIGGWRTYAQFSKSADRLGHMFDEAEDRPGTPLPLQRPKGRLALENVTFRYVEGAPPVIDGLSHTFAVGGMTAIMGRNGSGKTTLAKLLLGLYAPEEGRVLIDGADLKQFSRRDIARYIGYVPQDNVLFSGSIRDNIARAHPEAPDDDIVRAATLAQAHEQIMALPDGYGTDVGEGGQHLSGGMRQRIAIARALLTLPPVLIMDEPTANLDRPAEEELRQVLTGLAKSCTILVISHSPVLLQAVQHAVLIHGGKVQLAGTAEEVSRQLAQRRAQAQQAQKGQPGDSTNGAQKPNGANGKNGGTHGTALPPTDPAPKPEKPKS